LLALCLAGSLVAAAPGAEPPEPKPLTKEQQEKLKERDRLYQEVDRLLGNKQVEEGMALAEKALALTRQLRGEHHPEALILCQALAGLYEKQENLPAAKKHRQQVLAIQTKLHGRGHWEVTDARLALEHVELLARLDAKERALLQEAAALNQRISQLRNAGQRREALPLAHQAVGIHRQVLGERHPHYATSLHYLALLYHDQGEYAKAEPLYRQARDIQKQVLGERHPNYATSLNNLAELYRAQGEYAKAEPLYRQALEVRQQVQGQRHPDYAVNLNNLAALYRDQGEYAKAEPLYRQAMEITKQALGERHPGYAGRLNNLALLYQDRGEYAQAEPLFHQAIAALRERPESLPPDVAQLTAKDLRPLPDTVTCLTNYSRFLEERLGPRPTAARLRAAEHACALALAVRERLRQDVLEQDSSKLLHGAKVFELVPRRVGLCQRLFDQEGRATDLEAALATAEQGTARVFLDQLGKARAQVVGHVSAELRAQEAALRRQLRELDTRLAKEQGKPVDKRDSDKVGQLLDEQKKVEDRLTKLIRQMEKDYPQYAALKYPRPCTLAEARACLAPTEVALLFVPGEQRSYLILVEARPAPDDKAHGLAIYPLPGRDDIADGISRLTDRDTFDSQRKARAAGAQAYELLLTPVKERIKGKDLVVVPGGQLCYVPFEALVEDGRFLIEKHRIRYAPSLTALHLVRLWEQTRDKPQRPLWAMADPVYDKSDQRAAGKSDLDQETRDALAKYLAHADRGPAAGEAYARLRFTGQEAEAIRARLGAADADVLTGLQASEAAVKAASEKGLLARARYVHFATHGILGLDTGQPPALVLSLVGNDGARDEDGGINDGFLRLDEVTRLRLNADLVVLSACETGKGRLYAGEGVSGLARAFLYAGSRGVVCSLWAVDDRETAAFMADLYGGLKDGKAAADALRAAKLAMIRAGKPPVYWAPFILIGE
jgi:CHAT domain-containing protein/Tfp pilus assembly protein PilF